MKIVNHGRGIHAREVPGIDYFKKHLPHDWVAHTNLDLSLPPPLRWDEKLMSLSLQMIGST